MWKKINLALMLGLALSPPAAMAEGLFDPFAGIVEGIAQGLAVTEDISLSSSTDTGGATGGNVVIGNSFAADEVRQSAYTDGSVVMAMDLNGSNNLQAVNLVKNETAVLVMQGTAVGAGLNVSSSGSAYSVQAVNLITTCNGAECE